MKSRTEGEVLKECEELGEAIVEARIATGHFSDNPMPAVQWLMQRRHESGRQREQREMRNTRWALYASWVLVAITFLGIWWQREDNREQHELVKEQQEQQQKDSQAQRDNAKALLKVQISVELDKQFDSPEVRQARRRLATQLLNHKNVTDTRVFDFFDTLAMYRHQDLIDQDTVYQSYSYWVERYWPAIKTSIEKFREQENDLSYYDDFEGLYSEMLADDSKDGHAAPSKSEVLRFLREEATLPQ